MRGRYVFVIGAALALFGTAATSATETEAEPVPDADPVTLGTDQIGDWGGDPDVAQVGHLLGQDLVGAHLDVDPETTRFTIEVTYLPGTTGGVPEASRYSWNFTVDGQDFELDGKFTNYSRGTCDPTSGQCDPANGNLPRDPGEAPFFLRGNCTTNEQNITLCEELGLFHATFNPRQRAIHIDVPNADLGIRACSVIGGGTNIFGGSLSAAPSAFFTSSAAPFDVLAIWETAQVPSGDPEAPCPEA